MKTKGKTGEGGSTQLPQRIEQIHWTERKIGKIREHFSPLEWKVFQRVIHRVRTKEMAREFSLSDRYVETIRYHINRTARGLGFMKKGR
jgi:hypothetical protein